MSSSCLRALGLMSGTSVDGVDVALIETDGERVDLLRPVPDRCLCRRRAAARSGRLSAPSEPNEATAAAERAVTEAHVEAVKRWSRDSGIALSTIDVVGFHGQTITHRPERRFTWQIGDGAALARALGVRVVSDLRIADVAAGGQGAPLVPVYHAALARDLPRPLAVVNIGGVANVTWIGADGSLLAFDTGPGNGPIDDWCARRAGLRFDRDGALAAVGQGRSRARRALQRASLLCARRRPSRSIAATSTMRGPTGLSVADGAATLTRGTARAIALAARHFPTPVAQWVISGGGARNPTLLKAHRRGDARRGGDGRQPRLGRRRARGAGLRLPRRALAARPADHLSRNDRRAASADGGKVDLP